MIKGVHAMFYSSEAEALRLFLLEKLGLKANDIGDGWLIFELPEAEIACHPSGEVKGPPSGKHEISFYCDDIEETVRNLKSRGVKFIGKIENRTRGKAISFVMPGNVDVLLYQPGYKKSFG
jgi:hypothetical protein